MTKPTIIDHITALGAADARSAIEAARGGDIAVEACADITEDAVDAIRDILRAGGDSRAELGSLGYRAEGRELMAAYATGWDAEV